MGGILKNGVEKYLIVIGNKNEQTNFGEAWSVKVES